MSCWLVGTVIGKHEGAICPRFEDLLRDFARQGVIGVVVLHAMIEFLIAKVLMSKDEGLALFIESGIVQVLGGKGHSVNGAIAGISLGDDMLFNELHRLPPML
jgi:hypothetical protein